jgi:hypothetical protein
MAKPDQVNDEKLRTLLTGAFANMRAGKPTDAVHQCADAFLYLLELKPEIKTESAAARRGMQMPLLMRWPMLGANIRPGSVQEGKPEIVYSREKFALSEAITYYEFTLETAIDHGA